MCVKKSVVAAIVGITMLALPVAAGGPILIEDATEAAPRHDKVPAWVIVVLGVAVAAAISGGGSDACNGDPEPEPTPEPVGGC